MTRASITWGAGLSVALRSLPSMLIPPALAAALPAILAQVLSPDSTPEVVQAFLELPTPVQVFISLILLRVSGRAINDYQRRVDRRKLGPDVVEVPRLKLKWPGNLDYIPFVVGSRASDYCGGHWEGLVEKHGTIFNPGVFGGDQIMTVEPEHIKSILSTDFNSYGKGKTCFILIGPAFKEMTFTVLGNGVFNVDGEIWKFHRSMTRPYFSRDRISHFDNFARHSDAAIAKILSRLAEPAKPGLPSAVDFQDVVARFTLDSGTEFLFGRDVQSLEAPLPYPHEKPTDASASFAASFGRAQELIVYRMGLARLWSWMELFWDRTREDMDVINAYVTPILKKKLEDKRASGAGVNSRSAHGEGGEETLEEGPDTLLDHLVQFTDDETIIKDEVINILVAARDTTATTLTFAAYMLAENPEIMSRLRSEVLGRLGTSNYPTPEDFKEMKYLRAVLNETLRLFPAVPLNERAAVKSTVLQSNGKKYYVPAGAGIGYSVIYMHRRKDLWGPDADVFDPDRWLDDRLKRYVTPNPFIFLPFNAGPRICIGQQFAYNEASYFLCRLLQRIQSIELAPEAQPSGTLPPTEWKNGSAKGRRAYEKVWPKSHLTLYCNGGLWVRMKEASPIAE